MSAQYRILWKSGTRTESTDSWETLLDWLSFYREDCRFNIAAIQGVESCHTAHGWPWMIVANRRVLEAARLGVMA